jgi:hypothetical protein
MKFIVLFLVLGVTLLLVLQVRTTLVRPKWEYKVQSLDTAISCDAGMAIPEPELAKQGLNAPGANEARNAWAASIMQTCFNRLGNDGWELTALDAQHVLLKRLKQ